MMRATCARRDASRGECHAAARMRVVDMIKRHVDLSPHATITVITLPFYADACHYALLDALRLRATPTYDEQRTFAARVAKRLPPL